MPCAAWIRRWVRNLYRFSLIRPNLAFYFKVPLEVALGRILGGRNALKYYEAGMDLGLSRNIEESFRIFQGRILCEYEAMIEEMGFHVIDATKSIEEQQRRCAASCCGSWARAGARRAARRTRRFGCCSSSPSNFIASPCRASIFRAARQADRDRGAGCGGPLTQVQRLRTWLEELGHAVLDTGLARSALAGKGIPQAKEGNTLGPITMTLYYPTDFADRLENEIIPALRAGFVVLTDRYIFSIMARAIARGEDRAWIERVASFALVPHVLYYLRAEVKDLISRVVVGRGAFDYWESGMDLRFGGDMYDSFVKYQSRVILCAGPYGEALQFRGDRCDENARSDLSRVAAVDRQAFLACARFTAE